MGEELTARLLRFIEKSPSSFHVVESICRELTGYTLLSEGEPWSLQPGGRYYVKRSASALMAFRIPEEPWRGFLLAASHSDSPTFSLKENAQLAGPENYLRLNVEGYGGMLCASWLDRPLSVAGRVLVRRGGAVEARLVNVDRDLLLIPSVAIHMNREANKGYAYDLKTDLTPLYGLEGASSLCGILAERAGAAEEDLLSADLSLYVRERGRVWGAAEEFVSAPKIDDLQCVFGTLQGFLAAKERASVPVYCVFDNEEVGSGSKQGAEGTFLRDVLSRICAAFGKELPAAAANSFLVSADNAHAVHPNHPEYADATHRPRLNGGVVIKRSASQRYTTDGLSSAVFAELCRRAGVPVQHFANRSDLPGGSTLGNLALRQVSLNAVDIGLAQLAMHSAYETAGVKDTAYLVRAMEAFYGAKLTVEGDRVVLE